ncbi:sigma54 specific transcriptional regulator, Fis family [Desulfitobacterium hafniense DCB-2]|uniref:Signal-transduction and transcriptional-control protein n=3 Tax=Desulfitobacterium hafniense TaxID=49338 RepID=A0A098B490_DESHA|nr:sigma 54-interacting transcriptional regulator [Desulfitobacterium hafniense]ACL19941.1 sigma54 specific transcriptional regulator, Fis family [Desulfitobacterium hafniense DCB-2]CDX03703.1 Signal-transduction and transcriptional-control protein [Desulfitobacterium hafniense]
MIPVKKKLKRTPNQTWNKPVMTKERWEGILAFKAQFVADSGADPLACPHLDKMVAESWIRSRLAGVDPYKNAVNHYLHREQYEKIVKKSAFLIEVTKPLFDVFKNLIHSSNYEMHLIDTAGNSLLNENSYRYLMNPLEKRDLHFTLSSSESTTGTCAHALALRHKKPVQLFGPEHYLWELQDIVASSAPVFNENNEVIAALSLIQHLNDSPWAEGYQVLCTHTLALITAITKAIEAQLKLHKSYEKLADNNQQLLLANSELSAANQQILTTHDLLRTTLSLTGEAIITIDCQGNILEMNETARKILQIPPDSQENVNITGYLSKNCLLLDWVAEGKDLTDKEEIFYFGNTPQSYIVSMKVVLGDNKNGGLAVLRFQNARTYNLNATKRAGTNASFHFDDLIGESPSFKGTLSLAKKFSKTSANILLLGESGTGKELLAQSIHNDYRPEGPFIALNCAAIPRSLIESELFGYESGSFTGADRTGRPGKIELADKGTLFLDEIGDMPLDIQAVLLRVLEDRKVLRIGGRKAKNVDFRVIAATNKDLRRMVQEKTFREDIYFRLSVLTIHIPPLRTRSGDIEKLCQYFLSNYCRSNGYGKKALSEEALYLLTSYSWPGNIRQLENAIIYGINLSDNSLIEARHLPTDILGADKVEKPKRPPAMEIPATHEAYGRSSTLQEMELNAIIMALEKTNNSVTKAAKILNISKSTLYRRLRELNM